MIFALSPQAKGRVERVAGTFQDRLVTELRLSGANSIGEANGVLEQFLPRFNHRFEVPPPYPELAFRPPDPELCLEQIGRLVLLGWDKTTSRESPFWTSGLRTKLRPLRDQ